MNKTAELLVQAPLETPVQGELLTADLAPNPELIPHGLDPESFVALKGAREAIQKSRANLPPESGIWKRPQ